MRGKYKFVISGLNMHGEIASLRITVMSNSVMQAFDKAVDFMNANGYDSHNLSLRGVKELPKVAVPNADPDLF